MLQGDCIGGSEAGAARHTDAVTDPGLVSRTNDGLTPRAYGLHPRRISSQMPGTV
jgi:hypothetical protein